MKFCASSVVSADWYQWFIPFYSLSLRKVYPDCGIKLFIKGPAYKELKHNKALFGNPEIFENQFKGFPNRASTCNSLRHIIDPSFYKGYSIIYPSDVDFIVLPHKKPHWEYYSNIMSKINTPYAACRGPIKGFRTKPKGVKAWAGKHTRIAAGCSMYKHPEFHKQTANARKYYTKILKSGSHDKYDTIPSASYREYDEVMLYRICWTSGLRLPGHKDTFLDGNKFDAKYRDVHLGDYKFGHRWRNKGKMKRIFTKDSVRAMKRLVEDKDWNSVVEFVSKQDSGRVMKLYRNLLKHLESR